MMQLQYILFILFMSGSIQCVENKNVWGEDEKLIRQARLKSNDAISSQDTIALAEIWTNDYHIISSRNFEISGMENNWQILPRS